MRTPTERFVTANALRHRVREWDGGAGSTLFLLHGFLDHAHLWDDLVEVLPPDWHVVAFDWRGHGKSERVGAGGYYHFVDYVFDLADLVEALGRGRPVLCGHSMGGVVASLYCGVFPDRVAGLVLVEGLGPEAGRAEEAPVRVARWIDEVRDARARPPRELASLEDAARRLRHHNPRLDEARSWHMAETGTTRIDGALRWTFDPLHRTRSPSPFLVEVASSFWRRVACPVTFVRGAESGDGPRDLAERMACFPNVAALHVVKGAGHMVPIDAPEALAAILRAVL